MATGLGTWFANLRQLQSCCQNPNCAGSLKAFAKRKPSSMIPSDDNQKQFVTCFQNATHIHVQDHAFDAKTFREFLETVTFPLIDAASRFMFDTAGQGGIASKTKFNVLFPTTASRDGLFNAFVTAVSDNADGGFFPSSDEARQNFQNSVKDDSLTVEGAAKAIFPA